jgi:hypothetical protein
LRRDWRLLSCHDRRITGRCDRSGHSRDRYQRAAKLPS